jgi:hypothetical protein
MRAEVGAGEPGIDPATIGITDCDELEEDVKAMSKPFGTQDERILPADLNTGALPQPLRDVRRLPSLGGRGRIAGAENLAETAATKPSTSGVS